ncbi:MAG TPA: hypothetical protein VMV18_04770, partial [bacterium]|nr:hypothetical protein [bacterium]
IGRGPSTRGNTDGTEPGARSPSVSRTLNRPPEPMEEEPEPRREPSRTARPARPDKDFLQPGDDYEPPVSAPPPRRNRAPVDEQADLYPAPGSTKRVALHPAVLMLLGAIVFFAGVVLAKLM